RMAKGDSGAKYPGAALPPTAKVGDGSRCPLGVSALDFCRILPPRVVLLQARPEELEGANGEDRGAVAGAAGGQRAFERLAGHPVAHPDVDALELVELVPGSDEQNTCHRTGL